jgi:SAM-dependent methyltransferase
MDRFVLVRQDENTAVLSKAFGAVADDYDRLRPGPSPEALDWLIPEAARDALEIGAGTGILTRLLAERLESVTAVEPDDRMRAVLSTRLSEDGAAAGVRVVAGQAEALPSPDASVDVVLAASAWHWVDEARAVPEVARVLRPGGRLSLVWSGPDRSVDWMRNLWAGGVELTSDEAAEADRRRRGRHAVNVDAGDRSPFFPHEAMLVRWHRPMSKEDLVALATTYSSVITMNEEGRRAHLNAMTRYLVSIPELADLDEVQVPMRAYCWRARRR